MPTNVVTFTFPCENTTHPGLEPFQEMYSAKSMPIGWLLLETMLSLLRQAGFISPALWLNMGRTLPVLRCINLQAAIQ